MGRTRLSSGFIGRLLITALVTALAGVIAVSLVFLDGVRPAAAASSSLELPFPRGQTWVICQGYNTSEIDHVGTMVNALDLSISPTSASGTYGCTGATNASQGKVVTAPSSGTVVSYPTADMACIDFDSGGSARIGHIGGRPAKGTHVSAGATIGTLNPPNTTPNDGGYSHIHIEVFTSNNCSGTSIPFDDANQTRFLCAPNLPFSNGSTHQYYGTYLSRCGTVSSPATPGARLRVEVTLPGISPVGTNNHAPINSLRQVTVEIFKPTTTSWQRVAVKTGTVSYSTTSGAFTKTIDLGSTWASGNYYVKVRLPYTLRQTMGRYSGSTFSIAPGKTTYLPRTPIFTGDINNDKVMNILDYNIGSACWFQTTSCSGPGSADYIASDLDDNGTANQTDYNLWLRSNDGASKNCSNGTCVYNQVWSSN